MDGLSSDLQSKYQKLASEYSKVRAQVGVLKKAVLEEQTKNAEIRDTLKEKEQNLRKADQEMDSLTFRNQQLTKRVTVLQDELEAMSKVKKGKVKRTEQVPDSTSDVMGEELHKTITENFKLLAQLEDKELTHKQDVEHLTQRIEHLEHELRQQQENVKKMTAKLETEKNAAVAAALASSTSVGTSTVSSSGNSLEKQDKMQNRVELLQRSNAELTAHARELNSQRLQLATQLEDATRIIRSHLPFVDSSDRELNELNIPHYDCAQQAQALHMVGIAGAHVEELSKAFEEMHAHVRQRLLILHGALSPLNLKFSEHLQESGRRLHELKEGYTEFQKGLDGESWTLDTAPSLLALGRSLRSYSSYLQKLQPYHQLSMEEECILLGASEELHCASRDVVAHSANLCVQIKKISGYVHLLAGQSRRPSQHPVQSQRRFLHELTTALSTLHQSIQGTVLSDIHCAKKLVKHVGIPCLSN